MVLYPARWTGYDPESTWQRIPDRLHCPGVTRPHLREATQLLFTLSIFLFPLPPILHPRKKHSQDLNNFFWQYGQNRITAPWIGINIFYCSWYSYSWSHQHPSPKPSQGKTISVEDGDTITIQNNQRRQTKIRLYGIDTPEKGQAYGKKQTLQQRRRKQLGLRPWKWMLQTISALGKCLLVFEPLCPNWSDDVHILGDSSRT